MIRRLARAAVTHPTARAVLQPLTRGVAAIFMLHRFADPERGSRGHSALALAEQLEFLRRHGYPVVSLGHLVETMADRRRSAPGTVVFTVDDGYSDFARIAAPVFARYDCPVTVFVASGFIDGHCWYWWDRLEYAIRHTTRMEVPIDMNGRPRVFFWNTAQERLAAGAELNDFLKGLPEASRMATVEQIISELEVDMPTIPPAEYAPMTWDEIREQAGRGVTFAPHSVTHPILSKTDDPQSEYEIRESWERVRSEVDGAVPVFCYPNGDPASFGPREVSTLSQVGLSAAVTAVHGYVVPRQFAPDTPEQRYMLPRFPYPEDRQGFLQVVTGFERVKLAVRQRLRWLIDR